MDIICKVTDEKKPGRPTNVYIVHVILRLISCFCCCCGGEQPKGGVRKDNLRKSPNFQIATD